MGLLSVLNAFFYCSSLSKVVISDSVTRIGKSAFFYCSSLSYIAIPYSVTSVENIAFGGCNFSNDFKQELISRFGDNIC